MVSTLALIVAVGLGADGVNMKFVSSGATAKAGGYRPVQAAMDNNASAVKKAPEDLAAPKYGTLKIGDKSWGFILDEPEGKPARLFVDGNGDGDFTNDTAAKWQSRTQGNMTMHEGNVQVKLDAERLGTINMYRFDPKDPARARLANVLLFYTDYGYEVTLNLDGKEYTSFVSGSPTAATSLWIDRDGNKLISHKREMASVGKPFNFTGTTYVLKVDGSELKLETAADAIPQTPMPPDLAVGKKAIPFTMAAMDGSKIEFPNSFKGKLVMLDFWATWCGPCIAELPNVTKAYQTWHEKGFEIVGISFDAKDMVEKVTTFTKDKEMPWPQIYEGKMWETTLGDLYDVSSIPFVLLVDGDSGEIIATVRDLRGPGLSEFIGKVLAKKNRDVQ